MMAPCPHCKLWRNLSAETVLYCVMQSLLFQLMMQFSRRIDSFFSHIGVHVCIFYLSCIVCYGWVHDAPVERVPMSGCLFINGACS